MRLLEQKHSLNKTQLKSLVSGIADVVVIAAELDKAIRDAIYWLVVKRAGSDKAKQNKMKRYWSEPRTTFSQLLENFELLGGPDRLISRLTQFNTMRNALIHKILEEGSGSSLTMKARQARSLGNSLITELTEYVYEQGKEVMVSLQVARMKRMRS